MLKVACDRIEGIDFAVLYRMRSDGLHFVASSGLDPDQLDAIRFYSIDEGSDPWFCSGLGLCTHLKFLNEPFPSPPINYFFL